MPDDTPNGDPAAAREWRAAYERVVELVEDAGDEAMELTVPACPDWTARELLSHVIGLDHDVLAGDEADDHNSVWTQEQVDARADRSVAELLEEWASDADALEAYVRTQDPRPLGDLLIHEQDLRGALDEPGARDTDGLTSIRGRMAGRLAAEVDDAAAPVRLESDDWSWQSHDGDPGVVLRASTFDLTRALTSRRSEAQLRSWVTAGDLDPYLDAFTHLGPLPESDLAE
ncbi:maleylpyruvate isomerase family mycothiol-dependent enzyme [Solicola sp. PLA-1-18]|uniref:maleylpyruvate isomerase family mycothiol-dependent enzyme n=1 Tax=Solicola sp. PLA-1-18 TaxID=3380532 RepID=UPI003B7D943F